MRVLSYLQRSLRLVLLVSLLTCCIEKASSQEAPQQCPIDMPAGVCRARSDANTFQSRKLELDDESPPPHVTCHVFMAPSTLGETTNMGVYTGIPLKKGDVVKYPEIVIPILFREWGKHPTQYGADGKLWDRYLWEGDIMQVETYEDLNRHKCRAVFVPGVGCTVNSVLDMANVNSTRGSVYDTAGLSRTKDPGSGAFSPYHSAATTVIRDIAAGTELLARYGDYWIPDIPGAQVSKHKLMQEAEDFLQRDYFPFVMENNHLNNQLREALWEFTIDFPIHSEALTNLPKSHPWEKVSEMYYQKQIEAQTNNQANEKQPNDSLQPQDEEEDEELRSRHSVVESFLRQQQVRPLSWLHEHGYCQDHMVPGLSKIDQAGRGAFASRDLPKGAIVGYAPLIHVGASAKDLWLIEYNNVGGMEGIHKRYDLVINYSFSHPRSSVVLTPYGGMVNYINHDSKEPNVKVRWPRKELVAHKPEWLKKDANFLRDTINKIGLSFEYVALRDIGKDEEILLDYGPEWEMAWNHHVSHWEPMPQAEEYQLARTLSEPYFRTIHEIFENPYPPNVATLCRISYKQSDATQQQQQQQQQGKRATYEWLPLRLDLSDRPERHYCVVAERFGPFQKEEHAKDGESNVFYTYTVDMKVNKAEEPSSWIRVTNVTSEGVGLYDLAFTGDWHMPNVFRHPIGIPDDMMPKSWINQ